jgi:hypothetical protein
MFIDGSSNLECVLGLINSVVRHKMSKDAAKILKVTILSTLFKAHWIPWNYIFLHSNLAMELSGHQERRDLQDVVNKYQVRHYFCMFDLFQFTLLVSG